MTAAVDKPARATDASVGNALAASTRPASYDWTGFYFGGHTGVARGTASATAWSDLTPIPSRNTFGGPIGGAQLGYNYALPSHILLGFESDVSFMNYYESNGVVALVPAANGTITEKLDYVATARGRIGYAFAPWMIYGTAGLAAAGGRFLNELPSGEVDKELRLRFGWVVGAGVEYALTPSWIARLEYLYDGFGKSDVLFPTGERYVSSSTVQMARLGLSRKLDWPGDAAAPTTGADAGGQNDRWQIHGQLTYVQQGYPSFRSPYEGTQSLSGASQTRNTTSATAFVGVRLWDGGEFFYAPEVAQGFGLSGTLGLGGFSNGEAQKAGFPVSPLQHGTYVCPADHRSWW